MEIKQTFTVKNIKDIKPSVVMIIKDMTQEKSLTYSANKKMALNRLKNMIIEYAMSLDEDCIEETIE